MSNRNKCQTSNRLRKSRKKRRFSLNWIHLLIFGPFFLLMSISLIGFLVITVYRQPTVEHLFAVALIVSVIVVVIRARIRAT